MEDLDEIRRITALNYQEIMKSKVRHDQSDVQLRFTNHKNEFGVRINFKLLDIIKNSQIFQIKPKHDVNYTSEKFERRHGFSLEPDQAGIGDLSTYWFFMDRQLKVTNFSLKTTDYGLMRQFIIEKMLPEYSRICCSNVINSIMDGVYSEKVRRGANKTFFKWVKK